MIHVSTKNTTIQRKRHNVYNWTFMMSEKNVVNSNDGREHISNPTKLECFGLLNVDPNSTLNMTPVGRVVSSGQGFLSFENTTGAMENIFRSTLTNPNFTQCLDLHFLQMRCPCKMFWYFPFYEERFLHFKPLVVPLNSHKIYQRLVLCSVCRIHRAENIHNREYGPA